MSAVELVIVAVILIGHAAVWVSLLNQVHATAMPRWLLTTIHLFAKGMLVLLPMAALIYSAGSLNVWAHPSMLPLPVAFYVHCCQAFFFVAAITWIVRRRPKHPKSATTLISTKRIDVRESCGESLWGEGWRRAFAIVPGNQLFDLEVNEKQFDLPRLAPQLDGITVAHLSDLHFTGTVRRAYFDHIVEQTNAWDADFVAVTGDIVDTAACLDWIPETLGRLKARLGVYFVLGNHDLRVGDVSRLSVASCATPD